MEDHITRPASRPTHVGAATAIREYAILCHGELPEDVHVRSYAGLWLLLAVLAPAVPNEDRAELEAALGLDVETAAAVSRRLLEERRLGLGLAVAGWLRDGVELLGQLPVQLDPLPDQQGLHRWAQQSTGGVIPAFPVALHPDTVLVLANALTVGTQWREPLDTTDDDRLRVREDDGLLAVVETRAAGLVAVAAPVGRGDLDVLSVVARADVPQGQVWAAVDEVTGWLLDGSLLGRRVPAAELGRAGHAWTVKRSSWVTAPGSTATEVWEASIPAWRMESTTDLLRAPGVTAVTAAVLALVPEEAPGAEALQSATAMYTAKGFEAAAVTAALAYLDGSSTPPVRKVHVVRLTFDRPHAVVALTRGGAWDGVPVVHAWIDGSSDPELARPGVIAW